VHILRIDDRYIHGQVIAGWARPLGFNLIILASDKICQDEWSRNAYKFAVPDGIEFHCVEINNCVQLVEQKKGKKIMIIVGSVSEAYQLLGNGLMLKEVNIGGLGYKEGTREIANYIYLTPEDIEAVVRLYNVDVKVVGKQLPNSPPIDVVKMLAGVKL
jgi:mannose/fructose/N-acetylgalactosamine-specific phosphotransferase system component IIB